MRIATIKQQAECIISTIDRETAAISTGIIAKNLPDDIIIIPNIASNTILQILTKAFKSLQHEMQLLTEWINKKPEKIKTNEEFISWMKLHTMYVMLIFPFKTN